MAKGTELAVGYISLVADTRDLSKGVDRALNQSGQDALRHGQKIGQQLGQGASQNFKVKTSGAFSGVEKDAAAAGTKAGHSLKNAFNGIVGQGLATAGIVGGLGGIAAAFTSAVKSGVDYQANLNRIQGVTSATKEQMGQINAKARELGNDMTLTGVSTQNAAEAMLELTKGGFTVDQAMTAARGSLQLATAAGIEAGKASTIQADAIHAFNLAATDAGRVADVLANTANASTGEMQDFAYGLQMGGAVAHSFGMSIEDTAASLGMLANAGIKGSDAGTLLKSALLAITDQGNPAQGAIQELGLSLYDAQGKFVGMRSLLDQLGQAAKRMSPEMYQAASNILFGSDAARIAAVAGEQGAASFDAMRVAVGQQGAAAKLAAANTQGLPGVFERLSNTMDRAKLSITDLVSGPLGSFGDTLNRGLNNALDVLEGKVDGGVLTQLIGGFRDLAGTIASGSWGALQQAFDAIAAVAGSTLVPALSVMSGVLSDSSGLVLTLASAWAGWKFVTPMLSTLNDRLGVMGGKVQNAAIAVRNFASEQSRVVQLSNGMNMQMGAFGTNIAKIGDHLPVVARMQTAFFDGAVGAERFGRLTGVASAAMSGMKSAASGVIGMLGGPWSAALMVATAGLTLWMESVSQSHQRAENFAKDAGKMKEAMDGIYHDLSLSGGIVDQNVITKVNDQVNVLLDSVERGRRGAGIGDWLRNIGAAVGEAATFDQYHPLGNTQDVVDLQKTAEANERITQTMRDLGITSGQLSSVIHSTNGSFEGLTGNLHAAGQGGDDLIAKIQPLHDQFLASQQAAANLTPGVTKLGDAMKVLADNASSAEDRTNALKTAMDILAGKQPDVQQATDKYNTTVRQVTEATKEQIDATKGLGSALKNADGTVNTTTENGHKLFEALNQIKDSTTALAGSGGDTKAAFAKNAEALKLLADQYHLTTAEVEAMITQMGYQPEILQTLVEVKGADGVENQLTLIETMMDKLKPGTKLTIDPPSPAAEEALKRAGVALDHITVAGKPQVQISINGDESVRQKLAQIIEDMKRASGRVTVDFVAEAGIDLGAGHALPGNYLPIGPGVDQTTSEVRGHGGRASGGSIAGPGTATSDSIPIMASDGEHMWSAAEVRGAGGHGNVESLRGLARSGLLRNLVPGFAGGGPLKKNKDNNGGTDAEGAIWFAADQNGRPYDYGGGGTDGRSFDCSGYLSAIWGQMTGRGSGHWFSTEADFASLGFQKGYKPGALNIGVHHGGGGKNSHMAGTLPNGVNVESGGAKGGVKYGGGAKGAGDPYFEDHWYYALSGNDPALASAGGGAGGGGSSSTDGSMPSGLAGSAADPYATGAGGGEGGRTEGYIPAAAGGTGVAGTGFTASLYNMGAQAVNGVIDQAASAASTAASLAVAGGTMGAGAAAGPAAGSAAQFAIGLGTQAAKRGVSYGFQMASIATDSLVEQIFPFGAPRWLGYDYTGFMPQLPNQQTGATTAEKAQLKAAPDGADPSAYQQRTADQWSFLPAGFGGQGGGGPQHGGAGGAAPGPGGPGQPMDTPPGGGPNPAPISAPSGASPWSGGAGGGAPAAAAGGGQDPNWLKSLGLFDSGGMLPSGGAAINMSGQPEPVLTGDQWNVMTKATESLSKPGAHGRGGDYSIKIENLQVTDVEHLRRELDSRQKLQMMRYAGRP